MSHAPASGSKTLPSHSRKPTAPAASLGGTMPNPTRDSCRSAPADPDRQSLPPQSAPNVVAAATHPRRAAAETPSADPLGESCSSPLRPWCTNHSTLPHYALTSAKSDRLLVGGTLKNRTEVTAKNMFEKYPHADRVAIATMMMSVYCRQIDNSTNLSDQEK